MKAVTIQQDGGERRLVLADHAEPAPKENELLVAVRAFSLNQGETRTALTSGAAGARPGWDFAGEVLAAPAGSGFAEGARVVGMMMAGAWAERIAVAPYFLSALPDAVDFARASTLPVAGLTAAVGLSKRAHGDGRRVLVTAATGGVGLYAIQLAAAAGAHVTALVRKAEHHALVRELGADAVITDVGEAAALPRFDLIMEGVGGSVLAGSLERLASRGACVLFGNAGHETTTTFDPQRFRLAEGGAFGGTTLYGFFLGEELMHQPPGPLLGDLAGRLAAGTLDPVIRRTAGWEEIDTVARDLLARGFVGKAVLEVG